MWMTCWAVSWSSVIHHHGTFDLYPMWMTCWDVSWSSVIYHHGTFALHTMGMACRVVSWSSAISQHGVWICMPRERLCAAVSCPVAVSLPSFFPCPAPFLKTNTALIWRNESIIALNLKQEKKKKEQKNKKRIAWLTLLHDIIITLIIIFDIAPQQQFYELFALYSSTNAINTHQYFT